MKAGTYTTEYLNWVQQAELPSLTNTQHYFAEFLLENKEEISQIGDLETIFNSIREYLRNDNR